MQLVEEALLRSRETAAECVHRGFGRFAVFRIARQQLDGLGHRVVSHTTAATPIAPYLMNFFLRSLSRTSLGISLSISNYSLVVTFILPESNSFCTSATL